MGEGQKADLRFPRSRRLKQNHEFAAIKKSGQRMVKGCLIANWLPVRGDSSSRLGVITARNVGCAVERNRARRVMKEVFRLHQNDLIHPLSLVLVARPSIKGKAFVEVERDFLSILDQARLKK